MNATPRNSAEVHRALRARMTNVILMVPDTDWSDVVHGSKRMFRSYSRRITPAVMPTPAIAYRRSVSGLQTRVIWLEDTWQEPLGTINETDLEAEGFDSLSDFRRYFAERYPKGGFRPLAPVQVYRVRPLRDGDLQDFANRTLKRLGYL